jgi:hypothetical protein
MSLLRCSACGATRARELPLPLFSELPSENSRKSVAGSSGLRELRLPLRRKLFT